MSCQCVNAQFKSHNLLLTSEMEEEQQEEKKKVCDQRAEEDEGLAESSRTKKTGEHVPRRNEDKTASFYKH